MIEFTVSRSGNVKKPRWFKKYPRKRILSKGGEKVAVQHHYDWHGENHPHFCGDLYRFLLKNVGRPVDKVFSEFLQRCRKGTERYNLREWFYDMFENKEDIDYTGGFYLSNGIINYRKGQRGSKSPYPIPFLPSDFNIQNFSSGIDVYDICKKAEKTHRKQLIGTFYISAGYDKSRKATVYVTTRSDYKAHYFYMEVANIMEIGIGVEFHIETSQDGKYLINPYYVSHSEYRWSNNKKLPNYVFLAREEKISD